MAKVMTGKIRLSYFHGFEPHSTEEGKEKKYSTAILIPKTDTKTVDAIRKAVEEAKEEGKTKCWNGKIPPAAKLKLPLRDGDEEKPDDPNYAGMWFMNCSSKDKPGMIDQGRKQITDPKELKSGDYARITMNLYPFNTSGNMGVGAGLNNIQKWATGPALGGGGVSAEEDFDELMVDDEDDAL